MTEEEDFQRLFANVRDFDWDPKKRVQVFKERGFDFDDARHVFAEPNVVRRSDRKGETRYMVFGFLGDVQVVFVCTFRDALCWIITARRASKNERKKYYSGLSRGSTTFQE
jgi:uncharacterized DUF497 family protein